MTNNTPVGPGTRVTLLFSIELESGEQIDSTEQKPAEFSVGDGKLRKCNVWHEVRRQGQAVDSGRKRFRSA